MQYKPIRLDSILKRSDLITAFRSLSSTSKTYVPVLFYLTQKDIVIFSALAVPFLNSCKSCPSINWLNDKKQHNDKIRQENLWRYEGHERDNKKEIIHYYVKKRDTRDTKSIHGTRMGHK